MLAVRDAKKEEKVTHSAGFEPAREDPNRFQVYRLNHSAKNAQFLPEMIDVIRTRGTFSSKGDMVPSGWEAAVPLGWEAAVDAEQAMTSQLLLGVRIQGASFVWAEHCSDYWRMPFVSGMAHMAPLCSVRVIGHAFNTTAYVPPKDVIKSLSSAESAQSCGQLVHGA
jgi:hypothetical protein